MKTYVNILMKNEEHLLGEVLKHWKEYPVDKFLFWDDNSTDKSIEIVKDVLKEKAIVFKSEEMFNEAKGRNFLARISKDEKADLIFSLDCDELFSYSLISQFDLFCKNALNYYIGIRQCNVVNGTLKKMRMDPMYKNNYRFFVIPVAKMNFLRDCNSGIHQSGREPEVNAQRFITDDFAFIHLQAINPKFYAMKQVFYKIDQIKNKIGNYEQIIKDIDIAANNLQFDEIETPIQYISNWEFDAKIFDKVLANRRYEAIIKEYIEQTGNSDFCKIALRFLNEQS